MNTFKNGVLKMHDDTSMILNCHQCFLKTGECFMKDVRGFTSMCVKVNKDEHQSVSTLAELEGISLNNWLHNALTEKLERDMDRI